MTEPTPEQEAPLEEASKLEAVEEFEPLPFDDDPEDDK